MSGSLTDNELMLKVKNGDLDKMTLLFERHHRALFGFLYHNTRHREASEDMLQTVFYRMLKYRHTFAGTGDFKAWMYYLALNVLRDGAKKQNRTSHEYDISDFVEKIGESITADDFVQKEQDLRILNEAMDSLPESDREIIILSQFQKVKYREIAQILNTTEGAVKVRVHRAFNQLKSIYLKAASYGL